MGLPIIGLWNPVAEFIYREPVFVNVYGAQESIPLAYVAWRAGTTYRVVVPVRQLGIDFWAL